MSTPEPDTIEGFLAEAIMTRIVQKGGKLATHDHNVIYTAVLETLNKHLPDIRAHGKGLTRKEYVMRGFC